MNCEEEIDKIKTVNNNQYHEINESQKEIIRLGDCLQNQINGLKEMQGIIAAQILRISDRLSTLEYTHKHKHECSDHNR